MLLDYFNTLLFSVRQLKRNIYKFCYHDTVHVVFKIKIKQSNCIVCKQPYNYFLKKIRAIQANCVDAIKQPSVFP